MNHKYKILVIVGPTASGKSALAVELARYYNGEVISADSRQVYRGLDLGSGKITQREMRGIRHHVIDVASPKRVFSAARYQKIARRTLNDIVRRNKLPIIVGGTGFYIDALVNNNQLPSVPPNYKLRQLLEKSSAEQLFAKLKKSDPTRAAAIDPHNKRRLIRALEIIQALGKVPKLNPKEPTTNRYKILKLGIRLPNEELKNKIQKRLKARFRKGMLKEVEKLHKDGISWQRLDDLGLEYRWISRYLRGLISRKEMHLTLEREIRRYAKRQMTWFKQDKSINWIDSPTQAQKLALEYLLD